MLLTLKKKKKIVIITLNKKKTHLKDNISIFLHFLIKLISFKFDALKLKKMKKKSLLKNQLHTNNSIF
jgi:hypothetical protein